MRWSVDGENCMILCSLVLMHCQHVTDRWTDERSDGQTDRQTDMLSILMVHSGLAECDKNCPLNKTSYGVFVTLNVCSGLFEVI